MSTQKGDTSGKTNLDSSLLTLENTIDLYYNNIAMASHIDTSCTGSVLENALDGNKEDFVFSTPVQN